jgi:hypothetical protein
MVSKNQIKLITSLQQKKVSNSQSNVFCRRKSDSGVIIVKF